MEKESLKKTEAVCPSKMELAEVQETLACAKSGPQYWRSLEELAQSDGFFEMLHQNSRVRLRSGLRALRAAIS